LCSAVAAADLLRACALASANFFAQSGLTISVVITVLSVTAREVARLRPVGDVIPGEFNEEVDDMADVAVPRDVCPC
jgi:hypothetical protein